MVSLLLCLVPTAHVSQLCPQQSIVVYTSKHVFILVASCQFEVMLWPCCSQRKLSCPALNPCNFSCWLLRV